MTTEEALRHLSRTIIAPVVIEELQKLPQFQALTRVTHDYDAGTCSIYVEGLGNDVLVRADAFFTELETHGEVGSIELTKLLGLKTPRDIPGNLTTSLKRRAQKLGLERPWIEQGGSARTIWRDKNSIARRMREAVTAERKARGI